ncbi:MAG: hypothetical protein G01um10143_728 [Parcubacteria group bacterium Gr01-1014_3]|nr:MAG: hypothetical protein G01um10143_728 [Parcubacteria group bacterium Gr01-1014_3]
MSETFNPQSQERPPEDPLKKERIENVTKALTEAEAIFEAEGREKAKSLLPRIYDDLIVLNKRSKEEWETVWVWNSDGDLTEEEFNSLDHRRRLLSNAIGILTASGEIRHDLNKI